MKTPALLLAVLGCAFLARVLGQVIVALFAPDWLPPMREWYSGLMPYSILLPVQMSILVLQSFISWHLWRGSGFFARPYPRFGIGLCWFSYVYFAVMVARYVVTMTLFPERRWWGGTIPIFFHWVLAAYLFVWGRFHRQPGSLTA